MPGVRHFRRISALENTDEQDRLSEPRVGTTVGTLVTNDARRIAKKRRCDRSLRAVVIGESSTSQPFANAQGELENRRAQSDCTARRAQLNEACPPVVPPTTEHEPRTARNEGRGLPGYAALFRA